MVRNLSSLMLCILSALPVSHLRRGGLPINLSMAGVVVNSLVLTLLHHYAVPFPVYSPPCFHEYVECVAAVSSTVDGRRTHGMTAVVCVADGRRPTTITSCTCPLS